MNSNPQSLAIVAMMSLSLACISAQAEPPKFEEQIRYRQATMVMMKWHTEKISPLVKNQQAFNRGEALRHAVIVEMLGKLAMEGFVAGSYAGETKAKPIIDKDWTRFKRLGDNFAAEGAKLRERVQSADVAAIKAQLSATRKACKNCHDDFKSSSLF